MRTKRRRSHCQSPGLSPAAFVANIREQVARDGHVVIVVPRGPSGPGWAYTVGLHRTGLPELVVIGGLSAPDQHDLLHECAAWMKRTGAPPPGHREPDLLLGFDATFIAVDDMSVVQFAVVNRLQSGYRAFQLVWPDHDNRFPWDPGCAVPPDEQPLLGPPPQGG